MQVRSLIWSVYDSIKYRRNAVITAKALYVTEAQQVNINIGGVVVATRCTKAAGESRRVGLIVSASCIMYQQIVKWLQIYFLSKSFAKVARYPKCAHGDFPFMSITFQGFQGLRLTLHCLPACEKYGISATSVAPKAPGKSFSCYLEILTNIGSLMIFMVVYMNPTVYRI